MTAAMMWDMEDMEDMAAWRWKMFRQHFGDLPSGNLT